MAVRDPESAGWFLVVGIVPAVGVRYLLSRSHRQDDELLNFSIVGNVRQPARTAPAKEVVKYLAERTFIVATLLARASSENFIRTSGVPEGKLIAARQVLNGKLRENGLWEKLEPAEAALASAPDGAWSPEQSSGEAMITWSEQVRLLRWTLRIDSDLLPLAHFPEIDIGLAKSIVDGGKIPSPGRPPLASADLRGEREVAQSFLRRAYVELHSRNLLTAPAEVSGLVDEVRSQSLGASRDFLVGTKTIEEVSEAPLRQVAATAFARFRYCDYLIDQLAAEAPVSFSSREIG